MFRQIKGQDHVINLLSTQIANDRIAQAYLFHGRDGVGKFTTALYFGMALNCLSVSEFRPCGVCSSCHKFLSFEHTDFLYLFPTTNLDMSLDGEIKKADALKLYQGYIQNKIDHPWQDFIFGSSIEIRKESVMMLLKRLELSATEAKYRIVIIEDADMMNPSTANAFLKRLEEPPANTVIILITERIQALLPTILSRCQQVFFKPLSASVIEQMLRERFDMNIGLSRSAARIADGSFKEAARIAGEQSDSMREMAFTILDMASRNDEWAYFNLSIKLKDQLNAELCMELLRFLSIIVNDIAILPHNPELITNIDKIELLLELGMNSDIVAEKARNFLLSCEDLSRKIKGNVNLGLIINKIFYSLRLFLRAGN
jgi:DNA polymerase-3 subunit delta'